MRPHLRRVLLLLAASALAARQVREIGGRPRGVGRLVIFVETNALDREGEVIGHRGILASEKARAGIDCVFEACRPCSQACVISSLHEPTAQALGVVCPSFSMIKNDYLSEKHDTSSCSERSISEPPRNDNRALKSWIDDKDAAPWCRVSSLANHKMFHWSRMLRGKRLRAVESKLGVGRIKQLKVKSRGVSGRARALGEVMRVSTE